MPESSDEIDVVCPECGGQFSEEAQYCPRDGSALVSAESINPEERDPFIGEVLGDRFRVESILGEGGMGKVYRGRQLSVERPVAIKVIHSQHCDNEMLVKRFFREAKVISKFSHPNIVNAIEFDEEEATGSLYFVMEYIDGYPLEELVDEYHLRTALALEIAKQTCEALSEPHAEGVVHRDIKPENLMLLSMSDGKVQTKVVDFGVAHALKDGEENLTQTGMVYGTPHYMAPEQVKGRDVGPYTDVYALGVILYQMLSGTVPFTGGASMEIMLQHLQEKPAYVEELVPDELTLPSKLSNTIHGMLRKDPEERLDDVLEIRGRIEEIEREQGLGPVRVDPSADADDMFEQWVEPAGEIDPSDYRTRDAVESSEGPGGGAREARGAAASAESARVAVEDADTETVATAGLEPTEEGTPLWKWGMAGAALFALVGGSALLAMNTGSTGEVEPAGGEKPTSNTSGVDAGAGQREGNATVASSGSSTEEENANLAAGQTDTSNADAGGDARPNSNAGDSGREGDTDEQPKVGESESGREAESDDSATGGSGVAGAGDRSGESPSETTGERPSGEESGSKERAEAEPAGAGGDETTGEATGSADEDEKGGEDEELDLFTVD